MLWLLFLVQQEWGVTLQLTPANGYQPPKAINAFPSPHPASALARLQGGKLVEKSPCAVWGLGQEHS